MSMAEAFSVLRFKKITFTVLLQAEKPTKDFQNKQNNPKTGSERRDSVGADYWEHVYSLN